jgi:hypothetical protein
MTGGPFCIHLKSGGHPMTVAEVNDGAVACLRIKQPHAEKQTGRSHVRCHATGIDTSASSGKSAALIQGAVPSRATRAERKSMSVSDDPLGKAYGNHFWRVFWTTILIWPPVATSLIVIVSELAASHRWSRMGPLTETIAFIAYGNVWMMLPIFLVVAYAGCATSAVPIAIGIGWARAKRMPWLPACLVIAVGVEAIIGAVGAISTNLGGLARFLLGSGLVSGVRFPTFLMEPFGPIWSRFRFLMNLVEAAVVFIPTTIVCWWASSDSRKQRRIKSNERHSAIF